MADQQAILVTGGAGFIGSHTIVELLENNYNVIVIDNLVNANIVALKRVEEITNKKILATHTVDLVDEEATLKVFEDTKSKGYKISSVIHFAGLKAVGESTQFPLRYYENNIKGTINLLKAMKAHEVKNLVFSSSATVYGDVKNFPENGLTEDLPTQATNTYGRTKLFIEEILKDVHSAEGNSWNFAILRYFNPVGAHKSGKIGEDPKGIPNNLMPYITQVAVGKRKELSVFGNDYKTRDGTGIRDYIHVVDLAKGHVSAVKYLQDKNPGCVIYNLGTGKGKTVLEVVEAFKKASKQEIPFKIVARRPGDVTILEANVDKVYKDLGWKAELGLDEMCEDSWRWQSQNPNGYDS